MYAIYNKDGNRLYQFGLHYYEETARESCRKALDIYPESGAHIREVETTDNDNL